MCSRLLSMVTLVTVVAKQTAKCDRAQRPWAKHRSAHLGATPGDPTRQGRPVGGAVVMAVVRVGWTCRVAVAFTDRLILVCV